jgi:hypothetical protein
MPSSSSSSISTCSSVLNRLSSCSSVSSISSCLLNKKKKKKKNVEKKIKLTKELIQQYITKEFEQRREEIINSSSLDFNLCLSFTTYMKILLEIHKKISKNITFYILKSEKKEGLIFSNSDSKSTNTRTVFYKESFIEFYTSFPYIEFTVNVTDMINRIKNIKKNYFVRLYKYSDEDKIYLDNIPFFQLKLNKIFEEDELTVPSSGVIYSYNTENKKQEISFYNYNKNPIDEIGLKEDEKLYLESIRSEGSNGSEETKDFLINANLLCKIISFFNKKKFLNVIFIIESYGMINSTNSVDQINFLKIKGYKDQEEKTILLYGYENFNKLNNVSLLKTTEYEFMLYNFVYFIKIKNLNQETNNIIKIRFYKRNLFIESTVNNSGIFTVNIY